MRNQIKRDHDVREIYETKNLAKITEYLLDRPNDKLSLLIEALHRRITLLTKPKIIPLTQWALDNGVAGNIANNKALRQTIPAFRLRERWMIAADYRVLPNNQESALEQYHNCLLSTLSIVN
ncbi:MAG: hypothetical protein FWG61_06430 [Firmicutes bacterium]|nr:hypothetical protein [Bacillota bacterium]